MDQQTENKPQEKKKVLILLIIITMICSKLQDARFKLALLHKIF